MCWGSDTFGKSTPPKDVQFRQISSGNTFSCGISLDGSLYCWGDDRQGQSSPPPGKYTLVSCGFEHACALRVPKDYEKKAGSTKEGEVVCWGNYADGRVNAPRNGIFKWVSAGGRHSCAVKRDGKMTCWGGDKHGQVRYPTEVYYKTVSCGHTHSCAIKANGDLVCWGGNAHGQTVVPKKKRFKAVSAGWSHTVRFDSTLHTLHPTLYTLHPTPYTLHSTLYILHFLYPAYCTLYSTPPYVRTQHPTPNHPTSALSTLHHRLTKVVFSSSVQSTPFATTSCAGGSREQIRKLASRQQRRPQACPLVRESGCRATSTCAGLFLLVPPKSKMSACAGLGALVH